MLMRAHDSPSLNSAAADAPVAGAGARGRLGDGEMERLRGRNLSHIGCTLGLTLGLFLGLTCAVLVLRIAPSVTVAFAVFAGVTIVLGALGFALGNVATRRLWGGEPPPRS
jgi:hypothetical protein